MLDQLSEKFEKILKKLRGTGVLSEENIAEALKEVCLALLEADVNFKIVQKLNPWLKSNKLTVRTKSYEILLPAKGENLKPYKEYLQ